MNAEKIYKNANIFTADVNCPKASALAINDGKFIYVGDESGLAELEEESGEIHNVFFYLDSFGTILLLINIICLIYMRKQNVDVRKKNDAK